MLPNFIIIGAEKSGTTTLAKILSDHHEIFMSIPKEPRFFSDHNWDKGLKWYERLFDNAIGFKAIGEASVAYTWAPESVGTPQRIYDTLGEIKFIYIIRNPLERTISHYRHALFCNWMKKSTSIEDALKITPALIDCSKYFYQLEQYLKYFFREVPF